MKDKTFEKLGELKDKVGWDDKSPDLVVKQFIMDLIDILQDDARSET